MVLPPTSIFRCMPSALSLSHRRWLGALAYASDCAELSFERLKETARAYRFPTHDLSCEDAGWVPENRLRIIHDAWSCIDHISRTRNLVGRFPYGDCRPAEVDAFLQATEPAKSIRNRIQHLDEDIFEGKNCEEGHPVLGTVSWADARISGGHIGFAVASGPMIDGGKLVNFPVKEVDGAGDVINFELRAANRTVSLDNIMHALANLIERFEQTLRVNIAILLRDAALTKGVSLEEAGRHNITDMTNAFRMRSKPEGGWVFGSPGDFVSCVEVPPGFIDINEILEKIICKNETTS